MPAPRRRSTSAGLKCKSGRGRRHRSPRLGEHRLVPLAILAAIVALECRAAAARGRSPRRLLRPTRRARRSDRPAIGRRAVRGSLARAPRRAACESPSKITCAPGLSFCPGCTSADQRSALRRHLPARAGAAPRGSTRPHLPTERDVRATARETPECCSPPEDRRRGDGSARSAMAACSIVPLVRSRHSSRAPDVRPAAPGR